MSQRQKSCAKLWLDINHVKGYIANLKNIGPRPQLLEKGRWRVKKFFFVPL
jgi:hypothetical protein